MTVSRTMTDATRFDWSQWIFPGPRRVFTDEEMVRAQVPPWSSAIDVYVYSNVLVWLVIFYHLLPQGLGPAVMLGTLSLCAGGLAVGRWLWRQPSRRRFNLVSAATGVLFGCGSSIAARSGWQEQVREGLPFVAGALTLIVSSWWFLTLYRTQQIESRLQEQAAQRDRLAMAQRLAAAQIQPHFLFNTLASLQHWVDTSDERAGPMLRSLTHYLRATLPMFDTDRLPLTQELGIVRSYLDIMQARLGARLSWSVDLPEAAPWLDAASLPPGTLLTLAENAITHGIEPSLRGGHIAVRVRQVGERLRLEVSDSGQGLSAQACERIGLSNTRERLQSQYGERFDLGLVPGDPGCIAWIELPLDPAQPLLPVPDLRP